MSESGRAGRRETVRYHQEFYATHELFKEGSWLHRPSPFVLGSVQSIASREGVRAVDLGCGVGRHTIPIAELLPAGSYVVGIDLLPLAAQELKRNAADAGLDGVIQAVVADLDHVCLAPDSVDLLVSVSALEHSRDAGALERLLHHLRRATRPGGAHCLIIGTDKLEIDARGVTRPAKVEFVLGSAQGREVLSAAYDGWEWLDSSTATFSVDEVREGEEYTLRATNLRLLVRRPVGF